MHLFSRGFDMRICFTHTSAGNPDTVRHTRYRVPGYPRYQYIETPSSTCTSQIHEIVKRQNHSGKGETYAV